MHGLQHSIRAWLRTLAPSTLAEVIDSSLCIEEKFLLLSNNQVDDRNHVQPTYGRSMPLTRIPSIVADCMALQNTKEETSKLDHSNQESEKYVPPALRMSTSTTTPTPNSWHRPVHLLTDKECKDLRSTGLGFRCQQPYHPQHQCPKKELRTIISS